MSARGEGYRLFFDIGSPYAWVVAERASKAIPSAEWVPVLQPDVDDGPLWDGNEDRIIELAQKFALVRPRFSEDRMNLTIADSRKMALAATYAKGIGRTVAFSLAAFRQCFAAARAVDDEDTIFLAAAACELHPRAMIAGMALESTVEKLAAAGAELRELVGGRTELPVLIAPDGTAFTEDALIAQAIADFRDL
jgi:2-hydroxychromene-2-carboxylate isomerase